MFESPTETVEQNRSKTQIDKHEVQQTDKLDTTLFKASYNVGSLLDSCPSLPPKINRLEGGVFLRDN